MEIQPTTPRKPAKRTPRKPMDLCFVCLGVHALNECPEAREALK